MRTKKFYSYHDWGASRLLRQYGFEEVTAPVDADIIMFNGGEDISSAIYGEVPVSGFAIPENLTQRDRNEIALYNDYRKDETKLFFGICRGAQLLNCLNGGTLYQHVNNHGRHHDMCVLQTKEIIRITSTHHQAMRPGEGATIIATSSESTIKLAFGVNEKLEPDRNLLLAGEGADMEIIWYEKSRCLCIQGHPEYIPGSHFADYSMMLLDKYLVESTKCAA